MKYSVKMISLILCACFLLCCLFGCSSGNFFSGSYETNEPSAPLTPNSTAYSLAGFSASETNLITNTHHDVFFSVYCDTLSANVSLCSNDSVLCEMYDNGLNGDILAGDGIYSVLYTMRSETADIYDLHAKAGSVESEHIDISFFDGPTDADFALVEDIQYQFDMIGEQYGADENGNVPANQVSNVISETTALIDELYQQGIVREYHAEQDNIYVKFSSGIPVVFAPRTEGVDAVGEDVSVQVITLQPYRNSYSSSVQPYLSYPDDAAALIDLTFDNHFFSGSNNHDEYSVTLNRVRSFGENQVILWHGHGDYNSAVHSYLITGQHYYDEYSAEYQSDLVSDRLLIVNGRYAFTSKYIDRYCGSMENSFFYLGSCRSGLDSVLADSFLNKGAAAVIANSETIYSIYNLKMEYATAYYLCCYNQQTGNYYTLAEALQAAKNEIGQDDTVQASGKIAATPLIFGGYDAENFRLRDDQAPFIGPTQPPVGPTLPPSPTPEPTAAPTPTSYYEAYKVLLQTYTWINYCSSDLSEIPPDQYPEFWLGSYFLYDIDKDGTEELFIKAGQSMADMSLTFFGFRNNRIVHLGNIRCNPSIGVCASNVYDGIISVEHHGGYGADTYINVSGDNVSVINVQEYNYESPGYADPKAELWYYLESCSVHDMSLLDSRM